MVAVNKVFIAGNLTRDPELRYIPSGAAVANFSVAVNRVYVMQSGERREEVAFIKVVAWRKHAELVSQYLTKGSPVLVEGRIQTRQYETDQGEKRSVVEVVAERVQFLGRSGQDRTKAADAGFQGSESFKGGAAPEAKLKGIKPEGSVEKLRSEDLEEEEVPF